MATITARLDEWLEREIRAFWEAHGEGPSAGLRRVAEEWWALQTFSSLEFRDGVSGRRAGVRDGPDVWEIAMVAKEYGDHREGLYEHFGGFVTREALQHALAYAERFPDAVSAMLERNARMERLLGGRRSVKTPV